MVIVEDMFEIKSKGLVVTLKDSLEVGKSYRFQYRDKVDLPFVGLVKEVEKMRSCMCGQHDTGYAAIIEPSGLSEIIYKSKFGRIFT